MNSNELVDLYFKKQGNYYRNLTSSVFNEYLKLEEFVTFLSEKEWSIDT